MAEKDFQAEWGSSIRRLMKDVHYYKIPDPMAEDFKDEKKKAIKRPYDCYMLFSEKFYAMELKQIKKFEAIQFTKIETHQVKALKEVQDGGGFAQIVFNCRFKPTEKQAKANDLQTRTHNFVFTISIDDFLEMKKVLFAQGVRSIPTGFIREVIKIRKSHRHGHFSISVLEKPIDIRLVSKSLDTAGGKKTTWKVDTWAQKFISY